jgi:hypothetical protein
VLVLTIAIYDLSPTNKKILARLGIAFALAFTVLSSMHYYIQWAGVRQSILQNDLTGLGLFVQFNFDSPVSVINMLGWMFFLRFDDTGTCTPFKKKAAAKLGFGGGF